MHLYYSSTRNSASYKPGYHRQIQDLNYNYNRYSHMRRNTELAQPHLEYEQYLNRLDIFYQDREELYRQLEVESMTSKKSKKLIEEIAEDNKRKKRIIDQIESKRGISSKKTLGSNQSVSKISRNFEKNLTEARQDEPILVKDKMGKYNKDNERGKKQQDYKQKKYQFQAKRVQSNKLLKNTYQQALSGSVVKKEAKQVQALEQQIEFLKRQINEKNQKILELECSLVGQEKVNKRLGQVIQDLKQKQELRKKKMKLIPKLTNVIIKGKSINQKKKLTFESTTLIKIEPCLEKSFGILFEKKFKEKIEEIKSKAVSIEIQTSIQNPQNWQAIEKKTKHNSYQKSLQMDSNTLCWSIQLLQKHEYEDIDLTLSMSHYPPKLQESQKLCESVEEICVYEEQVPRKEERQAQTDLPKMQNNQTQTSDNYYDYIQNTYLDWMFEKQYQQLVAKKSLSELKH